MKTMDTIFISEGRNSEEIRKMFRHKDDLCCAVAFWGESSINLIKNSPSKKIKIICNLESGATNPGVIERFIKNKNIEFRTLSNLHAKIYFNNYYAIISSSNVSANGLGYEDKELDSWIEAGVVTYDKSIINNILNWFDEKWAVAKEINNVMLYVARKKWEYNRKYRANNINNKKSILETLECYPEVIKDLPIYITINGEYFAKETEKKINEIQEFKSGIIDAWENWKPPEGAYFIDCNYIDKQFQFNGLYETKKTKFMKIGKSKLYLCYPITDINGLRFTSSDQKLLKNKIDVLLRNQNGELCIKLSEAREILF